MTSWSSKVKILQPWEFWPFPYVYIWIYGYYFIQALRFRHPSWFSAVNPCMPYGGLYGYSKAEVLELLPSKYVPQFILVEPQEFEIDSKFLTEFHFPLILKPDVGERGIGVQLIASEEELQRELQNRKWPQIIQEYVVETEEFGILCERSIETGLFRVTSVTGKGFLQVEGNGKDSIKDLLLLEERNQRYVDSLEDSILNVIPKQGENLVVEPIGNHNRGTQFYDARNLISETLEKRINDLLGTLEGFNFGRLDVRCESWEKLLQGDYKIIELNGVASEPTHIYEGGFSYWEGQNALFYQWRQMVKRTIFEKNKGFKMPPIIQTFRDFATYKGKLKNH